MRLCCKLEIMMTTAVGGKEKNLSSVVGGTRRNLLKKSLMSDRNGAFLRPNENAKRCQ